VKEFLGMIDYPYPANFLEPLPAWPIEVFCEKMDSPSDNLLDNFASALGVYFNYTGQAGSCYSLNNTATPSLGELGWDYQCRHRAFLRF
jgi:lysosomal Pro-X carboxypeptidase